MLTSKDFILGQSIVTTSFYKKVGYEWIIKELTTPLKGIYIGHRTLTSRISPTLHSALIVTSPRSKPIYTPFSSLLPYLSPAS